MKCNWYKVIRCEVVSKDHCTKSSRGGDTSDTYHCFTHSPAGPHPASVNQPHSSGICVRDDGDRDGYGGLSDRPDTADGPATIPTIPALSPAVGGDATNTKTSRRPPPSLRFLQTSLQTHTRSNRVRREVWIIRSYLTVDGH